MSEELKPCPFCGCNELSVIRWPQGPDVVECELCVSSATLNQWNNRPAENKIKAEGMQMVLKCKELNLSQGDIDTIKLMQEQMDAKS